MDFSLFKNAHDTISTSGEVKRGMDKAFVTYFKAIPRNIRADTGVSHEYGSLFRRLHTSTSRLQITSITLESASSATQY
jgi:hypothetical protein